MSNFVRLSILLFVVTFAIGSTGCAGKKRQKQINALNAQVGVITDELVRIDQGLQDVRSGVQTTQNTQSAVVTSARTPSGASVAIGSVYRTPSGFELPSISIQQALKNAGYYKGSLDGKIGSTTKQAVKSFQNDHGLTSDGVVGRQTWSKLKVYLSAPLK